MTAPQRIQRKRSKGWRMPESAIYVGRPTRWGNPFVVHSDEILVHDDGRDWYCPLETGGARQAAVDMYREALRIFEPNDDFWTAIEGHDLACWCALDQPCHADILLELANGAAE